MNSKVLYNRLSEVTKGAQEYIPKDMLYNIFDALIDTWICELPDKRGNEALELAGAIFYLRGARDLLFAPKKEIERKEFKSGAYSGEAPSTSKDVTK